VILDFNLPEMFDSTTDISFAQLSVNMEFTLSSIFPMTLGCVPVQPALDYENLGFTELLDIASDSVFQPLITTYSTADSEADTAYFDVTGTIKAAIANEIQFSGLMLFPLESHTYIDGLAEQTPFLEVKINYSVMEP